jgi:3-hydroxyisobutyrate dehydrogenase
MEVPMPVTSAARDMLQSHIGVARLKPEANEYLAADFAALLETMAQASGMRLESEQKTVPTGLEG